MMDCIDPDAPCLDPAALHAWVSEQTGIDSAIVRVVLDVEDEYMWGVGINVASDDAPVVEYRYYDPHELLTRPNGSSPSCAVDPVAIAEDVERFTGVPAVTALRVFDAEDEYVTRVLFA